MKEIIGYLFYSINDGLRANPWRVIMERLYLALAAVAGGIATALLGWLDSAEAFDRRKFCASVVRSLFAGALFAATYELAGEFRALDLLWAFLGGGGIDALGNRVSAKLGNAQWPFKGPLK